MRVCHTTSSISAQGGGLSVALQALTLAQNRRGIAVRVVGHADGGSALSPWPAACPTGLETRRFPGMPWSFGMADVVLAANPDVLHSHGLWSQCSITGRGIAAKNDIPSVVSPHGMLDPWALANSRWKKKMAAILFENRHLQGAACLHALCQAESDSMRAYGLKNPIAIIPNGVDLPDVTYSRLLTTDNQPKVLLFLGRIHPKKGLINALRAWGGVKGQRPKVQSEDEWQFVVAGWDQGGHEAELKRLCVELDITYAETSAGSLTGDRQFTSDGGASVIFPGPAFGETKAALLRRASAFILPSFSEGLPMSVLEAWSYGLPVLMTDHCNLPEGFDSAAALRIGTSVESIAEGLRELFSLPTTGHGPDTTSLFSLGSNGRVLVERQFTWDQVAEQMTKVYEGVLGHGPKPGCVGE